MPTLSKRAPQRYRLSFDELRERFPLTAERFAASRYWNSSRRNSISEDLNTFLDLQEFVIINVPVFDKHGRDTDGPIGYEPVVKIKHQKVDIGGRWFKDFDQARIHALDYVLDIYEEELNFTA